MASKTTLAIFINQLKIKIMLEFKGTKGKWYCSGEAAISSDYLLEKIRINDNYQKEDPELCQCWADMYDGKLISVEEANANAKLISCAPEMLEMLQKLIIDDEIRVSNLEKKIIALIKKAIE